VTCLPVHAECTPYHQQYQRRTTTESKSKLLHYFCRPTGTFSDHDIIRSFDDLPYVDYFTLFRLQAYDPANSSRQNFFSPHSQSTSPSSIHVVQRTQDHRHLARLQVVHMSQGETFYLRALLAHRPARSFIELRTVNGEIHTSFQSACLALGIFADESEGEYCIREAIQNLRTPYEIRVLFLDLLTNDCIPAPLHIWQKYHQQFIADYLANSDVDLATCHALQHIAHRLDEFGKTLENYGLPSIQHYANETEHEQLRWNSQATYLRSSAERAWQMLTLEQKQIAANIINAVRNDRPLLIFIDGKAGTGKTFLLNVICNWLRGNGLIVLTTASSAFTAQLYPGGRITHSTFKVSTFSHTRHNISSKYIDT
jgi:PIF1-like helicase